MRRKEFELVVVIATGASVCGTSVTGVVTGTEPKVGTGLLPVCVWVVVAPSVLVVGAKDCSLDGGRIRRDAVDGCCCWFCCAAGANR